MLNLENRGCPVGCECVFCRLDILLAKKEVSNEILSEIATNYCKDMADYTQLVNYINSFPGTRSKKTYIYLYNQLDIAEYYSTEAHQKLLRLIMDSKGEHISDKAIMDILPYSIIHRYQDPSFIDEAQLYLMLTPDTEVVCISVNRYYQSRN